MKRMMRIICLLLVVSIGGCTTYYYQPGKTLEQCLQDSFTCRQISWDLVVNPFLYSECMKNLGYEELTKEQLPSEIRTCKAGVSAVMYWARATGQ
jgi:hypothetical protein